MNLLAEFLSKYLPKALSWYSKKMWNKPKNKTSQIPAWLNDLHSSMEVEIMHYMVKKKFLSFFILLK